MSSVGEKAVRSTGDTMPQSHVHTVPIETLLAMLDLREPSIVWTAIFVGAKKEIVIA
jgi:hypothetical protein